MEQGRFTPFVFSAKGVMGRGCKNFYSVLVEMITLKRKQEYCITMSSLRRKIFFLLRFIRGSRGKNLNQEEMNIGNDIEISESLSIVQE